MPTPTLTPAYNYETGCDSYEAPRLEHSSEFIGKATNTLRKLLRELQGDSPTEIRVDTELRFTLAKLFNTYQDEILSAVIEKVTMATTGQLEYDASKVGEAALKSLEQVKFELDTHNKNISDALYKMAGALNQLVKRKPIADDPKAVALLKVQSFALSELSTILYDGCMCLGQGVKDEVTDDHHLAKVLWKAKQDAKFDASTYEDLLE